IGRIDEAVKSDAGAGRHLASTDAHRLEREVAKDRMQAIPVDYGGPVPFRVVDARRAVVRATADEDGRRGRDRLREPPIEDDHGRVRLEDLALELRGRKALLRDPGRADL